MLASFTILTRSFSPALLRRNLRTSAKNTMKIIPVPVRSDNYAYLLVDEASGKAAAVDPYDVPEVLSSAHRLGVEIVACMTTHHHDDHCGGNHVREFCGSSSVALFPTCFADTVSSYS